MLHIDLETRSRVDLKKAGVYAYHGEIILFAYAIDDEQVKCIDVVNKEPLPANIFAALTDPTVTKVAHNANFERTVLAEYYNIVCPAEQWICTAVWAAYAGLPRSLASASMVTGRTKIPTRLLTKFCCNYEPCCGPEWEEFKAYNIQDVIAEQALYQWLLKFPMPEWHLWCMDQRINDRGFLIDVPFVKAAKAGALAYREDLLAEAARLTSLKNPNSIKQLKEWLEHEGSLNKKAVASLLETCENPVKRRVLRIRQSLALSSVNKYESLLAGVSPDGRVRGTLLYYGAHTGRWSGRRFQPQNLPKATLRSPEFAHELVTKGEWDTLDLLYGDRAKILSALVRSSITASDYLFVLDYSQIEARVCCWLAGEEWALEVFRDEKRDYYRETAAKMYKVANVTKAQRDKGKVACLLLQYQGSVGALTRAGTAMSEDDMLDLVNLWRSTCPNIVRYWSDLNTTAIRCVTYGNPVTLGCLTMRYAHNCLHIDLPAGRSLIFQNSCIGEGKSGPCVNYDADEKGRIKVKSLYGGLIAENVVQGISRDIMAVLLMQCQESCVLHVHDEIVLENATTPIPEIPWAVGLPLGSKSFTTKYYRKD